MDLISFIVQAFVVPTATVAVEKGWSAGAAIVRRLKKAVVDKDPQLETPITDLESAPDDKGYQDSLAEKLKDSPALEDASVTALLAQLVDLVGKDSASKSVEQHATGNQGPVYQAGGDMTIGHPPKDP